MDSKMSRPNTHRAASVISDSIGASTGSDTGDSGNTTSMSTLSTPSCSEFPFSSTFLPLVIKQEPLEHIFAIPAALNFRASQLKRDFIARPPISADDFSEKEAPKSRDELVLNFIGFITGAVEKGDPESRGDDVQILRITLDDFDKNCLKTDDIHTLASRLPGSPQSKLNFIKSYYAAQLAANVASNARETALFTSERTRVCTIFGGQGNTKTYFEELQQLFYVYPGFVEDLISFSAKLLLSLSKHSGVGKLFLHGFDVLKWLESPETRPDSDYMVSAPISFPLIGLLQLAHYSVVCQIRGVSPASIQIQASTGHSQGIVIAAAIAAVDSWIEFEKQSISALTILFWIGVRSQQAYPATSLAPSIVQSSIDADEGTPSPMLSVHGLSQKQLQEHIDSTNRHLHEGRQVHISLFNSSDNMVVTGPPLSLYGLNVRLRKVKATSGLDQIRIRHSKRKVQLTSRFLPVTAPFHSKYLRDAIKQVDEDLSKIEIQSSALRIPVYETFDGLDLSKNGDVNIVPMLIRLIMREPVHWEKATTFPGATHILDFGPGGRAGLGALISRAKEGTGLRVVLVGVNEPFSSEIGSRAELFDRSLNSIKFGLDWGKEHAPRLIRNSAGQTFISTKFSRLLGLPPIFVAGMTPTTVHWDFVSATMNAGYHIELAGGGYHNAQGLRTALARVQESILPGRGITINLIYVNPRAMAWQIPLIKSLRAEGVPIEGLTIGAGIPSLAVAKEYIETLKLKHIAFKPGSTKGIEQVIEIANDSPNFPIILQWTGGRAGGHHSCEDFHTPILAMYGKIRKCANIVLVAGSGFGSAEDTYPYLTGAWALKYGSSSKMPFDGCLFGSRVMIAKEAHTSPAAKQAIIKAEGVDDGQWETTYNSDGGGGVLTVISEMGEPIHKLATRGVKFWAEMDGKIFSLPKDQRVAELKKCSRHIIQRLNEDYHKVWFGKNTAGDPAEVEEMTYSEVARRLVALLFVLHERRWIDPSYEKLTIDYLVRIEQRFAKQKGKPSIVLQHSKLKDPFIVLERMFNTYHEAETTYITAQDVQYFLSLCQRPGQKPVTFIPILDEDFESYFKKDSLWQSEDLEAIVDQDADRTCILQGPVAVKFSKVIDEPIKDILGKINRTHIRALINDRYYGKLSNVPIVEYFGGGELIKREPELEIEDLEILQDSDQVSYRLSSSPEITMPPMDQWMSLLAGKKTCWRSAIMLFESVVRGDTTIKNPIRNIFAPVPGLFVRFKNVSDSSKTIITVKEPDSSGDLIRVIEVRPVDSERLVVKIFNNATASGQPVPLCLLFSYHSESGYCPIRMILEGHNSRVHDFYWKTWFGNEKPNVHAKVTDWFDGGSVEISAAAIDDFINAVGNKSEAFHDRHGRGTLAPMDFAVVTGWKAMIKPLFSIDGDLLNLVHLSNSFRMIVGARALREGDKISAMGTILSVLNQDSGKVVEVSVTITRDGLPVMEMLSSFFYRGIYTDYEKTFQTKTETPIQLAILTGKDLAILKSKSWFQLDNQIPNINLVGRELTFRLKTWVYFKDKNTFQSIRTTGLVTIELPTKEILKIAIVDYKQGVSCGNPVTEFLKRLGHSAEPTVLFNNPIALNGPSKTSFIAAGSNETYAQITADFNPIHVSRVFSVFAGLPGTITHGMHTSATVHSIVETHAAEGNPGRILSYKVKFEGMVLPGDHIEVRLDHIGMLGGRKMIKIEARNAGGDVVLTGEAEIEQPTTAYIFTGQGSQEVNMGMELAATSPVAKKIWDRADKYFSENYGFNITDIVKNNPKELTIHFGGKRGQKTRDNYMAMEYQTVDEDGFMQSRKMFAITENTTSYTYRTPAGLLSATQFTQPALTLMEKARFEDMKSRGLVNSDSTFAGHSLGEYGSLSACTDMMSVETLVSIVFFRGMTMQVAVERDASGRSPYSMLAVNPSRVSSNCDEASLLWLVSQIAKATGWLIEVVNYNIADMQYVCAGDIRALEVLGNVCSIIKKLGLELPTIIPDTEAAPTRRRSVVHGEDEGPVVKLVQEQAKLTLDRSTPRNSSSVPNIELRRGVASVPLRGIDVPFHSSFLRPGVLPYRKFLETTIDQNTIRPAALIGKWIPNLTARPFSLTKEYFEEVYRLTESVVLGEIIENWAKYTEKPEKDEDEDQDENEDDVEVVVVSVLSKGDDVR